MTKTEWIVVEDTRVVGIISTSKDEAKEWAERRAKSCGTTHDVYELTNRYTPPIELANMEKDK